MTTFFNIPEVRDYKITVYLANGTKSESPAMTMEQAKKAVKKLRAAKKEFDCYKID